MTRRAAAPPAVDPELSRGLRDDVLALLSDAPAGLSDAEIRAALADRHPGLKAQKINLLCRQMSATGDVERVGTRPIRNRLRQASVPHRERDREPDRRPAANGATVPAEPCPGDTVDVPVHDLDLAWSRGVNVAASVAAWLARRGATVRTATAADPDTGTGRAAVPHSHELVVRLDGEDVHVEITGWPPETPRGHPADAASEWFAAATSAAGVRRRAHPGARVVIALPETRRYRALAAREAASGPEVWFVDGRGAVRPLPGFVSAPPG